MQPKKRNWLGWVLFAAIMGGGAYMGVNPTILHPVADAVSIGVSESMEAE